MCFRTFTTRCSLTLNVTKIMIIIWCTKRASIILQWDQIHKFCMLICYHSKTANTQKSSEIWATWQFFRQFSTVCDQKICQNCVSRSGNPHLFTTTTLNLKHLKPRTKITLNTTLIFAFWHCVRNLSVQKQKKTKQKKSYRICCLEKTVQHAKAAFLLA